MFGDLDEGIDTVSGGRHDGAIETDPVAQIPVPILLVLQIGRDRRAECGSVAGNIGFGEGRTAHLRAEECLELRPQFGHDRGVRRVGDPDLPGELSVGGRGRDHIDDGLTVAGNGQNVW